MKKIFSLTAAAIITLTLILTSCGAVDTKNAERRTVKIYCWSEHMLYNGYAAYVQSQFPDDDVVFVVGQNNVDYYEFLNENGALPDIITLRRMSMTDAEALRPYLLDISETEAAASFNNIYLENYRFADGSINWLPACGEVDGYIANLDLFEKYGIALPTDRESFDKACEDFKAVGIMPYCCDFGFDYACLHTLQGLSIQKLMSADGFEWRIGYESGRVHTAESAVWRSAFERLGEQLKIWNTPSDANECGYHEMADAFNNGSAAMMRGTGNDMTALKKEGRNVCMLPYFGENEEDSWLLTYPSFNVAVSKAVAEDKEREELCLRVLEVMFSDTAQNILAGNHNMIPYNTGVRLTLDESMKNLEQYIKNNHLYLRLASNELFNASEKSVQGMITGEFTPSEAYDEFNRILTEKDKSEDEIAVHFDTAYSDAFDRSSGNASASVVTNTLREYYGADIVIANGLSYSAPIFAADYTERQLGYTITDTTIVRYSKKCNGAEIKMLLSNLLEREYAGLSMLNDYSLPIISGAEISVIHDTDGYRLDGITVNGIPIEDSDTFLVCYISNYNTGDAITDDLWEDIGGRNAWKRGEKVRLDWVNCILGKDSEPMVISAPTDYITLIEK